MLILSRVCAEFRDRAGNTVFNIGPHDLLSFLEAPEAIREDPLFALLQEDGSTRMIRRAETVEDYFATIEGFDFQL